MIHVIQNPQVNLPRSSSTPKAMASAQGENVKGLRRGAAELDEKVDRLKASKDLTDVARSRRIGDLRQAFADEHAAQWHEALDLGTVAEKLWSAHFSSDAIRTRAVLQARPADVAGRARLLRGLVSTDLYEIVVEAARIADPMLGALVISEARSRLHTGTIGNGDGEVILRLAEAIPLPPDEIEARTALEDVVIAGLEGDGIFRAASSGQPESAISRLQRQRRAEAVRGLTPKAEPPMDPTRLSRENRQKIGLP